MVLRLVLVVLALAGASVLADPARGAPPVDVVAYCETFNAQKPNCLKVEQAARARIERSRTAFHGPPRQLFEYCERETHS